MRSQTYTKPAQPASIGILVLRHQRERGLEQDEEIEQHRPVLDVIEVELDALLDFLFAVDFAAPAVDLSPAGNAGLDAVACEISVHRLIKQLALQFALHRVRTRADQRKITLEYHVEELWQFVKAALADEASDPGDAAVVLGHNLGGHWIGMMVVQRSKFEDVDALIVKSEAL